MTIRLTGLTGGFAAIPILRRPKDGLCKGFYAGAVAALLKRHLSSHSVCSWPKFGETWNDRTLKGIAAGGAAVMQRHGWTMGEAWGQFGPYIALIGATLPPSLVTWAAIQERREQQRRQERQSRNQQQSSAAP